jgi:hypothetical protein
MSSIQDCKNDLLNLRNQFYEVNSKNLFFKKKQKEECAKMICAKYDVNTLFANTVYQIGDTNKVFIDYTIFKLFINPDNYYSFIYFIFSLLTKVLEKYEKHEVHINLDSFTVTAAERYKDIIKLYCDESEKNNTGFIQTLDFMKLYNVPTSLEMITKIIKPILNPIVFEKIKLLSKEESESELAKLMQTNAD